METVHAHSILDWVSESENGRSVDDIVAYSGATHGEGVRYETCRHPGLSIQELIEFLVDAGKVHVNEGLLSVNAAEKCSH